MQDVAGGQVTFMFDQLTAGLPLVKAGKLRLLAVTTAKRTPLSPDTPTMAEAGVKNFEMSSWQAVYAPKGTPKPIVDKLNAEIVKILKDPGTRDKMQQHDGHRNRRELARGARRSSCNPKSRAGARSSRSPARNPTEQRSQRTSWNSQPRPRNA